MVRASACTAAKNLDIIDVELLAERSSPITLAEISAGMAMSHTLDFICAMRLRLQSRAQRGFKV